MSKENNNTKENNNLKYAELRDIPRVSLLEAQEHIKLAIKYNQTRGPIVLVGDSGLGKTQIFNQIARDCDYKVIPIHTAEWGLLGAGIPTKAIGDFFDIALPSIFPKGDEKVILLFDELNRGLKHAIAMFFTLLEDRKMFNYRLPKNCLVCGTMNPATAAYSVTQIEKEAAIRRRIKFMYVLPDFKGWLDYAASTAFHKVSTCTPATGKACHPKVLSYFKAKPTHIYDHKALEDGKQYSCPAVIETISEDIYLFDAEKIPYDNALVVNRIAASIGFRLALELTQHLENTNLTLSAEDVIYRIDLIKNKIKQLANSQEGNTEILTDLSHNVIKRIYMTPKPTQEMANNFVVFCLLIPQEIMLSTLQSLNSEAQEFNKQDYLYAFMDLLQKHPKWPKLHIALTTTFNDVNSEFKTK